MNSSEDSFHELVRQMRKDDFSKDDENPYMQQEITTTTRNSEKGTRHTTGVTTSAVKRK
jgi:hypothetical protein